MEKSCAIIIIILNISTKKNVISYTKQKPQVT